MALHTTRSRHIVIATTLCGILVGMAGCGTSTETTYSASKFSQCLSARDLSTTQIDTSRSQEPYVDALHRVAAVAARENGAVKAFDNDALPGASTLYFLFFANAKHARSSRQHLARIAREQHADDQLVLRGNLVTVGPTQTQAQARIVDECLKKAA